MHMWLRREANGWVKDHTNAYFYNFVQCNLIGICLIRVSWTEKN